jgi:tetratricopeptide (TPR) repeat protein
LREKAFTLIRDGNLKEALEMIAQLRAAEPKNVGFVSLEAGVRSRMAQEGTSAAVRVFDEAISRAGTGPLRLDLLVEKAGFFHQFGDLPLAIQALDEADKIDPSNELSLLARSAVQLQLSHRQEAREALEKCVKAHPKSVAALIQLSQQLWEDSHPQEALEHAEKAEKLPGTPANDLAEISYLKTRILCSLARFDDALASVEKAIAFDPKDSRFIQDRGSCYAGMERWRDALDTWKQARTMSDTPIPGLHEDIGQAHMQLGEWDQAQAALEMEKAISGRPSTEYWLGTLKFQRDQYDEALGHFNALLSQGRNEMPTNILAETLFAKSVCLERLNRLQEALATIEQALRINPKSPEANLQRNLVKQRIETGIGS